MEYLTLLFFLFTFFLLQILGFTANQKQLTRCDYIGSLRHLATY
jgi:Na+/proline symporter